MKGGPMFFRIRPIICFFYSLSIFFSFGASANSQPRLPWADLSILHVDSKITHKGNKSNYTSQIKGTSSVMISGDLKNQMSLKFLSGLGKNAPSLSTHFDIYANNSTAGTGSYGLFIASSSATKKQILQWSEMQSKSDPSLEIKLTKILNPDASINNLIPQYTNDKEIHGTLFIQLFSKNKIKVLKYADFSIPENAIFCSLIQELNEGYSLQLQCSEFKIINIKQSTWKAILKEGNRYLGLSEIPFPGISTHFQAATKNQNESAPHSVLRLLRSAFEIYYLNDGLKTEKVRQVINLLDKIHESQLKAVFHQKIKKVLNLRNIISRLSQYEQINQYEKTFLLDKIAFFADSLTVIPTMSASFDTLPEPLPESEVEWIVYQSRYDPDPDGTVEHPFITIAQALEQAELEGHTFVTLLVYGGVFFEALEINQDTFLYGIEGTHPVICSTIHCNGNVHFSMRGIDIMDAPLPGALTADHPGVRVGLNQVEIRNSDGYGIFQSGGNISLRNVLISNSKGEHRNFQSGAGAVFEDGVIIDANELTLVNNDGPGLIVRGIDTLLNGNELAVNRNFIDIVEGVTTPEDFEDGGVFVNSGGAIEISDHAEVHLSNLNMNENGFESILVTDHATLNIFNAFIRNTSDVRAVIGESDTVSKGGIGIRTRLNGHAIVTDFTISDNALVGILISIDGEMDLHNGMVADNPIGVHVKPPAFDTDRLRDNVIWDNFDSDIDTAAIYVPGADDPLADL
jgi:hypothetical protein